MTETFAKPTQLEVRFHDSLEAIPAREWDALSGAEAPFLSHAFLVALERHGCAGKRLGWHPRHVGVRDEHANLVGAMPAYLKANSFGEFVFDFSWASAYERAGMRYYPKLISAVPFTPVSGARLLVHPRCEDLDLGAVMIEQASGLAESHHLSSVHWLFPTQTDTRALEAAGLALRLGCQYHWHNHGYTDFEDFLAALTAKRRKTIRRERRRVAEQGIALRVVHGDRADAAIWRTVHALYLDTFDRKGNVAALTLGFFQELARTMGARVVLMLAERHGETVACAVNFKSDTALYGRYWGCSQEFDDLHFEACYYQGIDYCIAHGLQRFEPGAQGEHKIARGFLPTRTWSAHWIADPEFRRAIADFCRRERAFMEQEYRGLWELSPFRADTVPPTHAPPE